ncbi:hypothetical protein ABOZ73_14035 [Caulobacter sp. 73W]|uniref:Uncharacterized protein n=1 Tax=Caulobacter sp. 73W TaxID=3161137 RepID=A0AB39KPW4_9CAUL
MSLSIAILSTGVLIAAASSPPITGDASTLGIGADGKVGPLSYVGSTTHTLPLSSGETVTRLVKPTEAATSRGRHVVWKFPGGVFSGAAATDFRIEESGSAAEESGDAPKPAPQCVKKASTRQANTKPLSLWRCGAQTVLTSETPAGAARTLLSTSTPFAFVAAQPDPHGYSAPVVLGRMDSEGRISLVVLAWDLRN